MMPKPSPQPLPLSSPNPSTKICVFASTLLGHSPLHVASAQSLAAVLHERGIHLVYGGGTTGLMGALAKERVRLGGKDTVLGVIPTALLGTEREVNDSTKVELKERGSLIKKVKLGLSFQKQEKKKKKKKKKKKRSGQEEEASKSLLLNEENYGLTIPISSLAARKETMINLTATSGPDSGFIALSGGFGSLDEILEVLTNRQLGIHGRKMILFNVDGFWDGIVSWMDNALEKGFLREDAREMLLVKGTATECVDALRDGVGNREGDVSAAQRDED